MNKPLSFKEYRYMLISTIELMVCLILQVQFPLFDNLTYRSDFFLGKGMHLTKNGCKWAVKQLETLNFATLVASYVPELAINQHV